MSTGSNIAMDQSRSAPKHNTMLSLLVAALSLGVAFYTTSRPRSKLLPPSPIRVYNVITGLGLSELSPKLLDKDVRTNRTLWEAVDTAELHAGLERLEVSAWIPPHVHSTEEIVVVCQGSALVYDEHGHHQEMTPGAMVHIGAKARHAFRNVGDEPLLLVWLFPSLFAADKFEFHQRYTRS